MKRPEGWQALSILVPIFAAAISIAVLFRELLPEPVYLAIVFVSAVGFVGCSVWLVILTNPIGHLYRYLEQLWRRRSQRKRAAQSAQQRVRLIEAWADKWNELAELVANVVTSLNGPEGEQNKRFDCLRNWFIQNRPAVIPIWRYFLNNRTRMASDHYTAQDLLRRVFIDNGSDPFSFFYGPLTLWQLAANLRVQRRAWDWDPSETEAADAIYAMKRLSDLSTEFRSWARAHDSV